ncbi:MAG TPA: AAA family ATPase, partial [Polyangiales bacterium]|nr:AAA family ATPase [Polyangiales bacterium]
MNEIVAGRYRLERLLARGGMGEVYAAIDQSTNERIALKRTLARDGRERATVVNFMREYHALTELRHPRIIEVYDYGVDRERPYYTMELLDGQDVRELSPVPFRDACRYLRDVASSLALLHARRLLHRDLSPRNVRRTSDGRCKLLDFGAMVPFGVPPNLTGTPPCIAPEALQGGPLDQRSDLYSLGALAYFMLTGQYAHPVSELSALPRIWKQPLVRPMKIARDMPEVLDELVIALLSMDAMQRPASAAEVIDRLSAAGELEAQDDIIVARSFLTGSELLGRAAERAQLQKQVKRTLRGRGGAVLVCGESGTGKSRMLAETALLGQTHGLTVVRTVARSQASLAGLAGDLVHGLLQAAPLEAHRASAHRPQITAQPLAADSGETRGQLLTELAAFVQEVARERPLLITVDDLDRADEFSASFIAALAYQSSDCALSVVASCDSLQEAPLLANVPGLAEKLTLDPLDNRQMHRLTTSLFGDVPNVERVSDWLYRVAAGNPKLTVQLAEHLLNQGVVRYVDGTWVLPTEVTLQLPPGAAQALLLRLEAVSPKARALAQLLCVSRAGASAERILELARDSPTSLFGALEELVRAGVLESAGDAYVFAQDALRESLLNTLDPERRRELHTAWAERLLAGTPDRDDQLEAGWHLVHTSDELRGADILASIAPELVERRVNMAVAVPALERALEIYTRHARPIAQQLRIRSLLAMSSFLFDHRLADRYAESTLDLLYPFTGLALVERWSRTLNKQLAFALA